MASQRCMFVSQYSNAAGLGDYFAAGCHCIAMFPGSL